MLESVPLLAVTVGFISIFIYSYSKLQVEDIRAKWQIRRCEPLVMLMAQMVPTDPSINPSDFASDNFSFCIQKLIDQSLSITISPMMGLFKKQVEATGPIKDSMNYLNSAAASLMQPFSDLFGFLWKKLGFVIYQAARIFMKINSSFKRVFGIALSSIFAGMSMYKGIQNAVNFVLNVCVIILTILVILVVFLFFIMIPVLPLILTMIGILSATIYAGNVSGMGDSFCVSPGTMVATLDGWRAVETLVPGVILDDGIVEGILVADAKGALCVNIDGVVLSGNHLVLHNGAWISAASHPLAQATQTPAVLYCLNTSKHTWRVRGNKDLLLRDWEELPEEYSALWETYVYDLLNKGVRKMVPVCEGRGLLGADTFVYTKRGPIRISEVVLGDYVRDGGEFTRVIGVYKDTAELQPSSGPNPAVWCLLPSGWAHPYSTQPATSKAGYHIVTASGTFNIGIFDKNPLLIRDFTEVGWDRIDETYAFVLSHLKVRNDEAHHILS